MIINRKITLAALAISIGLAGLSDDASAATKKKVTLEQAWKACKERVDKLYGANTTEGDKDRYQAGAACMKEHGYNL